jgi:hypothetical protein
MAGVPRRVGNSGPTGRTEDAASFVDFMCASFTVMADTQPLIAKSIICRTEPRQGALTLINLTKISLIS